MTRKFFTLAVGIILGGMLVSCNISDIVRKDTKGERTPGAQPKAAGPCDNCQNTIELSECWDEQYKTTDAELNRVYKEITSRIPDEARKQLKQAQLAWIAYRDKKGDAAAAQYEGGTLAGPARIQALAEETTKRTEELKRDYPEQ